MKYIDSYIFKQYYFTKKLIRIINYYFDIYIPHKDHDENDIIVNIPTSTGNVTASAAVESSGTTMSIRQFSLPQAY